MKLDTVANTVLGEKKLENPYNSFKEFYSGVYDINVLSQEPTELEVLGYKRTKMKDELIKRGLI
jgi:hypothetical protein